jgi:hypothetical protein
MQNSKSSANSKGILIFAFNTPDTDYISIADCAAALAQKNLNLPVTLITDATSDLKFAYDQVICINDQGDGNFRQTVETDQTVIWRNFGRYLAYELSPYDQTILIDSDYFVLDNSLLLLFDKIEYQIIRNNRGLTGYIENSMGPMSLPYVWATVVVFDKSLKSQALFEMVGKVQRNYQYFCSLFNISATNYRNDYAFAIAHYIISNNDAHYIPYSMCTIDCAIETIELSNKIVVKTTESAHIIPIQNLHIMSKQFLTSDQFQTFYKAALNV